MVGRAAGTEDRGIDTAGTPAAASPTKGIP
jgi:hypothetical protein